jgi:hypothetical protein
MAAPRRQIGGICVAVALACAAPAAAQEQPCSGRAIETDRVITGEFGTELAKSFVMVPFDVPGARPQSG